MCIIRLMLFILGVATLAISNLYNKLGEKNTLVNEVAELYSATSFL